MNQTTSIACHTLRRTCLPLACYYAVTLGLPLVNGAAASGARFVERAIVVLVVPPIVVALAWGISVGAHVAVRAVAARLGTTRPSRRPM
jgi:hypothetical protein